MYKSILIWRDTTKLLLEVEQAVRHLFDSHPRMFLSSDLVY